MEEIYRYFVEKYVDGKLVSKFYRESTSSIAKFSIMLLDEVISNSPYFHIRNRTYPDMDKKYYIEKIGNTYVIHLDKEEHLQVEEVEKTSSNYEDTFFLLYKNDNPLYPSFNLVNIASFLSGILRAAPLTYVRKGTVQSLSIDEAVRRMDTGVELWCINPEIQTEGEEVARIYIEHVPRENLKYFI